MAIVSPTPPPSPTTGQQWWDGTTMWVWNATAWQAVGAGAVSLTFSMSQEVALTLPGVASSWQIIPYASSPLIDVGPGWDSITKKYTPKKAGFYAISLRGMPATGGGASGLAILKNDDGVFDGGPSDIVIAVANNNIAGVYLSLTGFTQMNGTTDYIRAFGYSASSSMVAVGSSPVYNLLHMP